MLGREVTYNDPETGELQTGTVEKVGIDKNKTSLTISGVAKIKPEQVVEVR
jgi:hypothetical protein